MSISLSEELTYENAVKYMRETFPNELIECEHFKNFDAVLKKMNNAVKDFAGGKMVHDYYKKCNRKVIEKIKEHDCGEISENGNDGLKKKSSKNLVTKSISEYKKLEEDFENERKRKEKRQKVLLNDIVKSIKQIVDRSPEKRIDFELKDKDKEFGKVRPSSVYYEPQTFTYYVNFEIYLCKKLKDLYVDELERVAEKIFEE